MSQFTHPICDECWTRLRGESPPIRMNDDYVEDERCCWCGRQTTSGIYVREDPLAIPKHQIHEDG